MQASVIRTLVAAAAALIAAAAHAGIVEVKFIEPEKFADAGRGTVDIERNTRVLAEHLKKLGKRLPDNQTLKIEVLDVDLAGEIRPFNPQEIRVLRGGADWPKMKLRYSLLENDRELRSGEESIADLNYLNSRLRAGGSQEPLAYDRYMLDEWFAKRFEAH